MAKRSYLSAALLCHGSALEVRQLPDVVTQTSLKSQREQIFTAHRNVADVKTGEQLDNDPYVSDDSGSLSVSQRLLERRKAYHHKCTQEMSAKLAELGQKSNQRIDELLHEMSRIVEQTETAVRNQLNNLGDENNLLQQNETSLKSIRMLIEHHEMELRDAVRSGEARVLAHEQAKVDQIAEIVDHCNKQLQVR